MKEKFSAGKILGGKAGIAGSGAGTVRNKKTFGKVGHRWKDI